MYVACKQRVDSGEELVQGTRPVRSHQHARCAGSNIRTTLLMMLLSRNPVGQEQEIECAGAVTHARGGHCRRRTSLAKGTAGVELAGRAESHCCKARGVGAPGVW